MNDSASNLRAEAEKLGFLMGLETAMRIVSDEAQRASFFESKGETLRRIGTRIMDERIMRERLDGTQPLASRPISR